MNLYVEKMALALAVASILGLGDDATAQGPPQREVVDVKQQRKQFAEFDAIYIPALALTNKQELAKSKRALHRLARQWPTFQKQWSDAFDDPEWGSDLESCDQAITKAGKLLDASRLSDAHEALEPIRDILMRARRRNGFDYPLDALSEFHGTMEQIVKPAMKMVADDLSPEKLNRLGQLCTEAGQKWSVVERTSFSDPALALTDRQLESITEAIAAERKALERLSSARQNGDRRAVLQAARSIKPPFARLYMSFGDFAGGQADRKRISSEKERE